MGFHAPQEAARVLGEAADYARQGQVKALESLRTSKSEIATGESTKVDDPRAAAGG
jgi:formate-dependent nitrite reductase cytochrome c552 subunit